MLQRAKAAGIEAVVAVSEDVDDARKLSALISKIHAGDDKCADNDTDDPADSTSSSTAAAAAAAAAASSPLILPPLDTLPQLNLCLGMHPERANLAAMDAMEQLIRAHAAQGLLCGIGEVGLDFSPHVLGAQAAEDKGEEVRAVQRAVLAWQVGVCVTRKRNDLFCISLSSHFSLSSYLSFYYSRAIFSLSLLSS